ncbi:hypothetical protein MBLNU457_g0137t1 [Dothideomycetes sp. NU457]
MELPHRTRQKNRPTTKQKPGQAVDSSTANGETPSAFEEIVPNGDLILVVQHDLHPLPTATTASPLTGLTTTSECTYVVRCDALRHASPYFRMLLDPHKFGEGKMVAEKHKQMADRDERASRRSSDGKNQTNGHHSSNSKDKSNGDDSPAGKDRPNGHHALEDLPTITIKDIGRTSSVKTIRGLMGDFLRILHGLDPLTSQPAPPLVNVANLCVVADRFDALDAMRAYFKSKRTLQLLDGKTPSLATKSLSEEKTRQRLFVGLMLHDPYWVWHASLRLIHQGWINRLSPDTAPQWWDLPSGIEEELLFRRECILETFQSVQSYFLDLYCSRERQCKLGYDSSGECDVFQLGQMVRFLRKINSLELAGTLLPAASDGEEELQEAYDEDVATIIDSMRQCPEYQIDKNHHHCGLRTRLMPILDLIEYSLTEVAVCLTCWTECRGDYAWSQVKRPLIWKRDSVGSSMVQKYNMRQSQSHLFKHLETRDMFMAVDRVWTSR